MIPYGGSIRLTLAGIFRKCSELGWACRSFRRGKDRGGRGHPLGQSPRALPSAQEGAQGAEPLGAGQKPHGPCPQRQTGCTKGTLEEELNTHSKFRRMSLFQLCRRDANKGPGS